jgi:hypothetical protein
VTVAGSADTDEDGDSNWHENHNGTDFLNWDSDHDGMPDGWEYRYSLDPLDPNDADADSDQDGMEDGWELDNGLSPETRTDADEDPDGDGATNLDEFIALTDPNLATSRFKIDSITVGADTCTITIQSALNRVYTLQYRDELGSGDWIDLPSQAQLPGTGAAMLLLGPASSTGHRFFRVTVALP